MEDTIKSSQIFNRKVVLEIRYEPNPSVIDNRGALVNKIIEESIIQGAHWEMGVGEIRVSDSLKPNNNRQLIYADLHRLSIINSKNDSNEGYHHFIEKSFRAFKAIIPNIRIIRIGCRIQGTYECRSQEYNNIVKNFQANFPSTYLLDDFNVKDIRFQLVYQNGQYHIGPISKDDIFLKQEFPFDDVVQKPGIGIDTDNYIIRSKDRDKISESSIKDVLLASLSVEKLLFQKLKDI